MILAARRTDFLEQTAVECRALGVDASVQETDVGDPAQCERLIAFAGEFDVLVNNAGFAIFDAIADASRDDLHAMMETNYFGMVNCTQAALPEMLARRRGSIVNVASIAGVMGFAHMGGYCASKFATIGFTESLRNEVISSGLRVALVCPGTTKTDFFVTAEKQKMPAASRLLRTVSPEEVARAICDAAVDGRYRRILPFSAAAYMRLKELFPRFAHLVMRRVSSLMERG